MKNSMKVVLAALVLVASPISAYARGGGHSSGGHSSFHSSFHGISHENVTINTSKRSRSTSSLFGRNRTRYSSYHYRPYYYHYGMYHPFYPYHHYNDSSYLNNDSELSLADWLKTTRKTQQYVNKFTSLDQFESKAALNCSGSLYGCKSNSNFVSHDYDVAVNAGFKDAMKTNLKTYGTPDFNSNRYHTLRADYHKNKYRADALKTPMFNDKARANTIKTAYFFGYAAGLYSIKNHL